MRPPWVVIGVLCAIGVAASVQFMLLVPVLPLLPVELDASPNDITWLVTAAVLAGTVATPIISRLADMFGPRPMIIICLVFIIVGASIGLLTEDVWILVVARAISGMSNAVLPVGIAVMRRRLPPRYRGLGIALMGSSGAVGLGIALPLGGWLNAAFGWQSTFAFALAFALILLLVVPFTITGADQGLRGAFDVAGAALLASTLVALLIAISNVTEWGWLDARTIVLLVVVVVGSGSWYLVERSVTAPLIDVRAAADPSIIFANIASLAVGFTIFGNILVMTSQLQVPEDANGFGLDPVLASTLLSIPAFTLMIAAPVASVLVQRMGARGILLSGAALIFLGYATRFVFLDSVALIVIGAVIIQLGSAASVAAIPVIVTMYAPEARTASVNGVNLLVRSIGSSVSTAAVAAAFTLTLTSPSGLVYPAPEAFLIFFGLACGGAVLAFLAGLRISNRPNGLLPGWTHEPA